MYSPKEYGNANYPGKSYGKKSVQKIRIYTINIILIKKKHTRSRINKENGELGVKSPEIQRYNCPNQLNKVGQVMLFWISVSSSLKRRQGIRCALILPALKFYSSMLLKTEKPSNFFTKVLSGCSLPPLFPDLLFTKQKHCTFQALHYLTLTRKDQIQIQTNNHFQMTNGSQAESSLQNASYLCYTISNWATVEHTHKRVLLRQL